MGEYLQKLPGRETATKNLTRVGSHVFKILSQNLNARESNNIEKVPIGDYYEFLVVDQLFEQLSHTWSEAQNIAGRLGQVAQKYTQTLKETQAAARAIAGGDGQIKSNLRKIDSPLMYETSDRRKFNLTVNLRDQNEPQRIMAVVDAFKRYSSPKIGENKALAKIDFPYIFEVATVPKDWFVIQNAYLVSIQAQYSDFVGGTGYPATIDMILNFEELEPLYESTFNQRATVTTAIG